MIRNYPKTPGTSILCFFSRLDAAQLRGIIAWHMRRFPKDHVFILPQAEEYRTFYGITRAQVLTCLNKPDTHEGLATGHYTAEKAIGAHQVCVYYYVTLPLQGNSDEVYAIVDFIGAAKSPDPAKPEKNKPLA